MGLCGELGLSIVNSFIFVLITYMSAQFCKPLDGEWQQFLMGYREKSLDAYLKERCESTEEEKARKFHEEAIKDANRQILVLRALL